MISKMSFGVRQVRDFLSRTGCVLTVRGYDYATDVAVVPELENIRITRKKICEIKTAADLIGFLPLSGFADVRDWWRQICQFAKGKKWLYRVQIDEYSISEKEREYEERERRQMFAEQNAWSNEDEARDIIEEQIKKQFFDDKPIDKQKTPIEELNVFSGSMQHPRDAIDDQREYHDPFMVDLQPSKEAARSERLQREERAAERKRDRMRERAGEQQRHIRKTIPA